MEIAAIDRRDPVSTKETITLIGAVERVVFYNEESGFLVLSVKAQGFRERVTVVGVGPAIAVGESIVATGEWKKHARFGQQFAAQLIKATAPSSEAGMRMYLSSKAINGIGSVYADLLVDRFGAELFNIIEFEPDRLREVPGIGDVRVKKIKQAWDRQREHRAAILYLHEHGVGAALANRVVRTYGGETVKIVNENPYCLATDIRGVGFKTADALALNLGTDPHDIRRVRAGVYYLVGEATDEGNCGIRQSELVDRASEILGVDNDLTSEAVVQEIKSSHLIAVNLMGEECVFLPELFHAEQGISDRIKKLCGGNPCWKLIDADKAIPWFEKKNQMTFSSSQSRALRLAVASKFVVVTGGPGVGKTTIVNAILDILSAVKVKIKLCAPTGRAARRLTETTGRSAVTIHRLLGFDPITGGFKNCRADPLRCDLIIVDEVSMIDTRLMNALLQAVPDKAAIILVGDVDQLPSVGPGRVLADIIESRSVPVVRLNEVFRQARQSRIVTNAHRINAGSMPDLSRQTGDSDFYFVASQSPEEAIKKIVRLVCERIPEKFGFDAIRDTQVLCPMIRGAIGVRTLNAELQAALNPDRVEAVERFGFVYSIGDKVMQIRNDYERYVFNGDIGFIAEINQSTKIATVIFDGRAVEIEFDEMDGLMPAYAVTIHKSQGSEFPAVVMPIMTQHFVMLKRKLLYTGVTRGKRLVVLVGQERAVGIAVRSGDEGERLSRLGGLLA